MKSYKFIAYVYLLNDILPHLSRLSCIFQKENVDLSLIQSTIDAIKKYVDDPGPNLSKCDEVLATELKLRLLLSKNILSRNRYKMHNINRTT